VITLLSIIALGFFLGMRHATDPDHVIAVTTIVTRQRRLGRAALIGVFWGVGHTVTILVVGTAIILFNVVIPTRIGLSMELSVGLMLIILGLVNIRSFLQSVPAPANGTSDHDFTHTHEHSHGDHVHTHAHVHAGAEHAHNHSSVNFLDRVLGKSGMYQQLRPLLVGIVHGLAGSAAVALLVLTTIRNSYWAIVYLLVFGVGTIAGMMVITMSIASTLHLVSGHSDSISRKLSMASGVLSLVFGVVVAYQICVVNGLFSLHPQWTPR
jgi:high-affinity nickel-transport protein